MQKLKFKRNIKKRIIATVIDYSVFFLMFYVYLLFFGTYEDDGSLMARGWTAFPVLIIWIGYFVIIEGTQGGTLAHLALGLKVVKADNRRNIGIQNAFIRHLLDPLDIYAWGLVAFMTVYFSDKHQRIGDLVAKTIVIDTGDPEQMQKENN